MRSYFKDIGVKVQSRAKLTGIESSFLQEKQQRLEEQDTDLRKDLKHDIM